jgi:hypothetical protein
MAMRRYLIALILVALLITPAFAKIVITAEPVGGNLETVTVKGVMNYEYDPTAEGRAIQRIGIDVPTGTTVDFTLTYGNGNTVSGTLHYFNDGFFQQTSEIDFGPESSSYTYVGLQEMGRFYVSGYAKNETEPGVYSDPGFVVFGSTAGLSFINNDFVYYQVTGDPVIYKLEIGSNAPVDVAVYTNPRDEVATAASKSFFDIANEWVEYALSIGGTIYDVVTSAFKWIRFFFIDHLAMTVALYIAGSLAFSARACRGNPIRMLRQFFKDQVGLFHFILDLWGKLIEIISSFRSIFRI